MLGKTEIPIHIRNPEKIITASMIQIFQICILELFLKVHATLKKRLMADENLVLRMHVHE